MGKLARTVLMATISILLATTFSVAMAGNTVGPSSAGDGHSQGPVSTSVVNGQTVYSIPPFTIP